MDIDRHTTDDSAESAALAPRSEPVKPVAQGDESSKGLVLDWTSFLLVQRSPAAAEPEVVERPIIVAASQDGLDDLGSLDDVSQIWFVRLTTNGGLQTDQVVHLRYWPLDREGTCLTAMLCESGALFIAAPDDLFEVDEAARQWFAKTRPERGHPAMELASSAQRSSHRARHG